MDTLKTFFQKAGPLPGSLAIEIEEQGAFVCHRDGTVLVFDGKPDDVDCHWRVPSSVLMDIIEGRRTGYDVFMRGEAYPTGDIRVLVGFSLLWHGPEGNATLTELDNYRPPASDKARQDVFTVSCADDVTIRCAVWTPVAGADKSVLFLNGRTEFIEKYYEAYEALIDRGFAVATLDWRGQGLSTRECDDPHKGYVRDFDDFQRDLTRVWYDHLRSRLPGAVYILGHSMGGHNAIRFAQAHQEAFAGLILSAPMVRIKAAASVEWAMRLLSTVNGWLGRDKSWLPGQGRYDPDDDPFEGNSVTNDPVRLELGKALIRKNPALALGGVTSGWLKAALASQKEIAAPAFRESLTLPVTVVYGTDDTIVDGEAGMAWAESLPRGQALSIQGARHELLRETDAVQAQFWSAFDRMTN